MAVAAVAMIVATALLVVFLVRSDLSDDGSRTGATAPAAVASATGLFVATDGSDANPGTEDRPLRTLAKIADMDVAPGQTIYLRGGTYDDTQVGLQLRGTADRPVTVTSYPGETAILDGGGLDRGDVLSLANSSHVVVEWLTARNGRVGLIATTSDHITFRNNVTDNTADRGIGGQGDHITFQGNKITNSVMSNERSANRFWGAGLSAMPKPDGTRSSHISYIDNEIRDSWGECLSSYRVDTAVIRGNTLVNCYSVSLYLDNTRDVEISHNYLYEADASHRREGRPANGILIGNEYYANASDTSPVHDVTIRNNVITGAATGLGFWVDPRRTVGSTYYDISFDHNVIANSISGVYFPQVPPGQTVPTANVMRNNIIIGPSSIADANAWSIDNNAFPAGGTIGASARTDDPMFADGGAVGDPRGYRLRPESPLRGAGVPLPTVPTDFDDAPRGVPPAIGAFDR